MTSAEIALVVVTSSPSTPVFIAGLCLAFGFGVVYFVYLERKRRANERKSFGEAGMVKHIQSNPVHTSVPVPKFDRKRFAIALILSLVSIIFGIEYFWNTATRTPDSYLFAGFVFVISGVVVIGFFLRSWVLYKIREFEQPSEQT